MSAKNDMRRRFASIDEGQNFSDVESVINYILNLRDQVETLLTDKKALTNSLNIAIAGREKLEQDYKKLLEQLKEKRKECEEQETLISQQGDSNKALVERINKCADKFDEFTRRRNSSTFGSSTPPLKKNVTWAYFSVSARRSCVLPWFSK